MGVRRIYAIQNYLRVFLPVLYINLQGRRRKLVVVLLIGEQFRDSWLKYISNIGKVIDILFIKSIFLVHLMIHERHTVVCSSITFSAPNDLL